MDDNPTITYARYTAMGLTDQTPHPPPVDGPRTISSAVLGARTGLMPSVSPLQASPTGSSASSAISVDSLDPNVPEAEEIKDAHTIKFDPKPFASGGYADVHRGTWIRPGVGEVVVAVKVLRVSGLAEDMPTDYDKQLSRIDKHLAREMHSWQMMHHKRITPLYGYMASRNALGGDRPLLVSPYYKNKNLRIYLHSNPGANKLDLLYQAAEGLDYLHSHKPFPIAHLDMKAENVLITDEGEASICDFGVARVLDNVSTGWTTSSPAFTAAFASPEVLRGDKGKTSADVYSFAGLILEVMSGHFPWWKFKSNVFKIIQSVEEGKAPLPGDHPIAGMSEPAVATLWQLLNRCWSKEPTDRPPMNDIMTQLQKVRQLA